MDIDITFWIGVISLVLSFPLTIAANLATPRVLSYLEKRRLIKAGKTRKEALLWYNYLRAYHEGRRDKYPYYIVLAASAVLFAIASSTLFIFAFLIAHSVVMGVSSLIVAIILAWTALLFLTNVFETERLLERFDDYKKRFEEQWGPLSENDLRDKPPWWWPWR